MRYILLLFLVAIVSTLQAQHNFTNGSVSFYTDHTALSNQQESVDFMLMGSCEISGTLRYHWVNRNGTDYEGPNWFEWNEGECYITINDTYGEPSSLQIEISGKCDCIGDDEASRLSTFEFSGEGKPNWISSPQEMFRDVVPTSEHDWDIIENNLKNLEKNTDRQTRWLNNVVRENDYERRNAFFTEECLSFTSDAMSLRWGYPGSISEDEFKSKWQSKFDLKHASFGNLFQNGNCGWATQRIQSIAYLGDYNNGEWYKLIIQGGCGENDYSNTLVRIVKIIEDGDSFKIASFLSLDDEASRLSSLEFSGEGEPNRHSSTQEMYGDAKPNMSIDQCIGTFKEDFSGLSEEELMRMNIEVPGQIKIEGRDGAFCFNFYKVMGDWTELNVEGCYNWKGDQLVWDQSQTESHDFHTVECSVEDGKRKVVLKGDDMAFAMYEEKAENVGVVERWAEQRTSTIPPKPAQNQNGPTFWCVSSVVDFLPMSIAASSTLPTDGTYSYAVSQMGDDNPQTAWAEGADGDGVGESLTFIFSGHPEAGLSIYNGLQYNDALFKANGRVEAFEMWVEGRHVANLMLNDSPGLQVIDMTGIVENGQEVRLVISKVYSGSKYSDTCISEMWITGG